MALRVPVRTALSRYVAPPSSLLLIRCACSSATSGISCATTLARSRPFRLSQHVSPASRRYDHTYNLVWREDLRSLTLSQHDKELCRIPRQWLRDNCRCEKCVNQDTMQRNFDTFQLDRNLAPESIKRTDQGFEVTWSDAHISQHSAQWLQRSAAPRRATKFGIKRPKPKFWGREIASKPPKVSYEDVMEGANLSGMARLTSNIQEWGFCFVENTPENPEATEKVLERIGPIRNTHYGGFYDFIPDLALADTAYTNLALPAHTDTTYFTEPARLQAFHMLSHKTDGQEQATGGESLLVDGFRAASMLAERNPAHFEALATLEIPWHASGNEGIAIAPDTAFPVLERKAGQLFRVRWNNDDRGVVPLWAGIKTTDWYRAASQWNDIIKSPSSEYRFPLKPGSLLIFDNWRVMHGRSAFTGVRRMCGGYIGHDDFMSRWKSSNFLMKDVIGHNLHQDLYDVYPAKGEIDSIIRDRKSKMAPLQPTESRSWSS